MDSEKLKRVMSAVEEFAGDEMTVTRRGKNEYEVKGYTVNIASAQCECKDHKFNEPYCKHLIAASLHNLWNTQVTDTEGIEVSRDGGRPEVLVQDDTMPTTLTAIDTWLIWEYRGAGDHRTAVPLNPETGEEVTGIQDCVSYERAVNINTSPRPETDGVMFLLSEYDPFTVERHTDVRDTETGMIDSVLKSAVESPLSYVDVAPNGTDVTEVKIGEEHATEISPNPIPLTGIEVSGDDLHD